LTSSTKLTKQVSIPQCFWEVVPPSLPAQDSPKAPKIVLGVCYIWSQSSLQFHLHCLFFHFNWWFGSLFLYKNQRLLEVKKLKVVTSLVLWSARKQKTLSEQMLNECIHWLINFFCCCCPDSNRYWSTDTFFNSKSCIKSRCNRCMRLMLFSDNILQ
jgi:hypothetical protein